MAQRRDLRDLRLDRLLANRALDGALVASIGLALLPFFGTDFGKGAVRWYSFGFAALQPSEFLKLAVVILAADLLTRRREYTRAGSPVEIHPLVADVTKQLLDPQDEGAAVAPAEQPVEEGGPRPADVQVPGRGGRESGSDRGLVAHGRDVGAPGRARAHDDRDLRHAGGRQPCLVEENSAEMNAIGKHRVLHGKVSPAGVHQVNAGKVIFQRDLLGPEMLFYRHGEVGSALDGGVVALSLFDRETGEGRLALFDLGSRAPDKPFVQHDPGAPDPEVLRQGGDTIADAVEFYRRHYRFFESDAKQIDHPTPIQGNWKVDAIKLVKGNPAFTDDVDLSDTLIAKVLYSPHANARLVAIDDSAALELPGVHAVVHHGNVPRVRYASGGQSYPNPLPYDQVSFDNRVRFVGDRVAAVAGDTEEIALAALDLIDVTYEVLPAVFDENEAILDGAPVVHDEPDMEGAHDAAHNLVHHIEAETGDVAECDTFRVSNP